MFFLLYVLFSLFGENNFDDKITFIGKAKINAVLFNNHWVNLTFDNCLVHGAIMSPMIKTIYPNSSQDITIWPLANDTTLIHGKCIYRMLYKNVLLDTIIIHFYSNILLDIEYYRMESLHIHYNITNNYMYGHVHYILSK